MKLASFVCAWQLAELVGTAFTLRPPQSPQATALRATLIGEDGSTFERLTTSKTPQANRSPRQAPKEQEEPIGQDWYVGTIKSYFPEQGFGFIECPELFELHQADVFLHKNQVDQHLGKRAFPGDKVKFLVGMNKAKKPQARNVARFVGESADTGSWVDGNKTYVGRVDKYWPAKGYGFIACEETRGIFQSDVFLHKNQAEEANLQRMHLVTFSVEINSKGRPQARNVERVSAPSYASREPSAPAEADVQMEDA